MIRSLTLTNFKNFERATLDCGPFTLLIGANASGKSNIRDAFRFLHGVGRGYKLADIFGEKHLNGALQWQGIRGGLSEIAYRGARAFALEVEFESRGVEQPEFLPRQYRYVIRIQPETGRRPRVVREALTCDGEILFTTHEAQVDPQRLKLIVQPGGDYRRGHMPSLISDQPMLSQLLDHLDLVERQDEHARDIRRAVRTTLRELNSMRFLELSPAAMREPSFVGQPLGDRGENLSSVLFKICEDDERRSALREWIEALTPMDAQGFHFPEDQRGRVLLTLVEQDGHETSAYSASEGTLRFLCIAAALLGGDDGRFYFLEELENGIHPGRIDLLLQLIERSVQRNDRQIVATTHSPQLLRLVSDDTFQHVSLVFRTEGQTRGQIRRLVDLPPAARDVLDREDRAWLYESGWFEDAMAFAAEGMMT